MPLTGPAYLVSHGGAAFPDVEFVLQGKASRSSSTVRRTSKTGSPTRSSKRCPTRRSARSKRACPRGPHSILGTYLPASANYSLCGQSLTMPTIITGQNGAQIKQATKIAVSGCKPFKPTVNITKTKVNGSTLLVTVKTSAKGRVRISGKGLKSTVYKNVNAGTHRFKVKLTKVGIAAKAHRKKTVLRVSLTVSKQEVANTTKVRL